MDRLTITSADNGLNEIYIANPKDTEGEYLITELDSISDSGLLNEIAKRLAAYEDAEESGLFVRLPCKVGDMVYEPRPDRGIISTYEIKEIGICRNGVEFLYWTLVDGIYSNLNGTESYNIGETVFLTREEAEKALNDSYH